MEPEVETFLLQPDGDIPNNALPLLLYRQALPPALQDAGRLPGALRPQRMGRQLGRRHLRLLAFPCDRPRGARLRRRRSGGRLRRRRTASRSTFAAGDVVVIPAGVGHKRLSEKRGGFTVVGGYPPGQSGTITRPGEIPLDEARATDRRARSSARRSDLRHRGPAHRRRGRCARLRQQRPRDQHDPAGDEHRSGNPRGHRSAAAAASAPARSRRWPPPTGGSSRRRRRGAASAPSSSRRSKAPCCTPMRSAPVRPGRMWRESSRAASGNGRGSAPSAA